MNRFWSGASDAFRWKHYFRFAGVLELNPDWKSIRQRTRDAIKGVYFCDVTKDEDMFVVDVPKADAVVASLVLDVVAVTDHSFAAALKNLKARLKPKGILVMQGSLGEGKYTVGGAAFPVMNVDEERLRGIFGGCGFRVRKWETCVKETTHYFTVLQQDKSE